MEQAFNIGPCECCDTINNCEQNVCCAGQPLPDAIQVTYPACPSIADELFLQGATVTLQSVSAGEPNISCSASYQAQTFFTPPDQLPGIECYQSHFVNVYYDCFFRVTCVEVLQIAGCDGFSQSWYLVQTKFDDPDGSLFCAMSFALELPPGDPSPCLLGAVLPPGFHNFAEDCLGSVTIAPGGGGPPPPPPAAPNVVGDPLFSPPAGTYPAPFALTIVSATPGAMIHFTTNGTEPNESSPTYSSSIGVLGDATIKAKAYKSGLDPSATVSASYTIGQPPPAGNAWDIELQGIGIGANQCGNCTMLNSPFLAMGVYLDSAEPTLLVLDVPPDCGEGRYLRWVVDFTPGQPIRVELRLGWFLSSGAVEYLLAVYSSGESSSNWLTSHEAVLPVAATYYDPHLSCSLSGSSVRLRSFAY